MLNDPDDDEYDPEYTLENTDPFEPEPDPVDDSDGDVNNWDDHDTESTNSE